MSRAPRILWLLFLLAGCGPSVEQSAEEARVSAPPAGVETRDPALAAARAALEDGHADEALAELANRQGFEATCLRARAELLRGDGVASLAALEDARELAPAHPELLGTEVEVLAALGKIPAAGELLETAMRRHGPVPALLRAQGAFELQRQGRAGAGLEALERARAADRGLPFVRWYLAQAHLLVGRARLEAAPAEATAHAQAAQGLRPELLDALELEAEGRTGELRFEEAIALYAELEERSGAQGVPRDTRDTRAVLHQRCATRCLLEHDRAGAVENYSAARALGLDDDELGFGAQVLAEERRAALDRGIAAADAGEWSAAEEQFARALALAPGDPEAENHLAVARFSRADFRGAAEAWQGVLATSRARGLVLPDPVPLNLAKAWRLAGEPERSRAVLADLLDREPEGPWSEPARELLAVLEAEQLSGR